MRERARRQTEGADPEPGVEGAAQPFNFATNTAVQDILKFIADTTGINVIVEQGAQSVVTQGRSTLNVDGLTLEQALNLVMTQNQLWYKVINERTIFVIQDTPQKRQQYEEQMMRTFYMSHADPQEMYQPAQAGRCASRAWPIAPFVSANKTTNTITVRGTPNIVNILEKVIQANDRPRAEVIVDVEILEVNRDRAKELGLNLSQYQIGAIFSPEGAPRRHRPATGTDDGGTTGGGRRPAAAIVQPEHDLARHQHGGLLPDRAVGDLQLPRQRHAHAPAREAAAARRGRRGARAGHR